MTGKPPSIGALRERLTLQSPSRTADGGGGAAVTWETVAELWAHVRPISGDERLRHDAVAGRVTHEVWIRHRADVVPAMRFTDGGRILDIVAVLDAGPRLAAPTASNASAKNAISDAFPDDAQRRAGTLPPDWLPGPVGCPPMKLTLTLDGLARLPRYDATRLTARLQSEFERELQATAATSATARLRT